MGWNLLLGRELPRFSKASLSSKAPEHMLSVKQGLQTCWLEPLFKQVLWLSWVSETER